MNKSIITYIQDKLEIETASEAYGYLGITPVTGMKYNKKKDLSNSDVWHLIKKARRTGIKASIQVITEYYPITLTPLRNNHDFIDVKGDRNHSELKKELENSCGVYVFYNSSGKAIYIGKAVKQNLYKEMRSAFNRPRNETKDTMVIIRSQHNINKMKNISFDKGVKRDRVNISDVSAYFSAYYVDKHLITIVEAMMIRAFANNLTNSKIEAL